MKSKNLHVRQSRLIRLAVEWPSPCWLPRPIGIAVIRPPTLAVLRSPRMHQPGQNCQLSDVMGRRRRRPGAAGLVASLLGAVVVLSGGGAARAQPASVPMLLMPASGLNVSGGILDAARDLLKDHLQRTGRYSVLT